MNYSNIQRGILAATIPAVTTAVTLYTVPAKKQAEAFLTIYNSHSGAIAVTVSVLKKGATTAIPIYAASPAAGATAFVPAADTKYCLGNGDKFVVTAATADKVSFVVSGTEFSM